MNVMGTDFRIAKLILERERLRNQYRSEIKRLCGSVSDEVKACAGYQAELSEMKRYFMETLNGLDRSILDEAFKAGHAVEGKR